MDLVTEGLLDEFAAEQELNGLERDKLFEHFAAFLTVRRHHSETFNTADIVTGGGDDMGIDAFAALVNGVLVTDTDALTEIGKAAGYLDVTFVFVQAAQTASFDTAKISSFGFGVLDFFNTRNPKLSRNKAIADSVSLMKAIYRRSSKFNRGNPQCKLYYVTTGRWKRTTRT